MLFGHPGKSRRFHSGHLVAHQCKSTVDPFGYMPGQIFIEIVDDNRLVHGIFTLLGGGFFVFDQVIALCLDVPVGYVAQAVLGVIDDKGGTHENGDYETDGGKEHDLATKYFPDGPRE